MLFFQIFSKTGMHEETPECNKSIKLTHPFPRSATTCVLADKRFQGINRLSKSYKKSCERQVLFRTRN